MGGHTQEQREKKRSDLKVYLVKISHRREDKMTLRVCFGLLHNQSAEGKASSLNDEQDLRPSQREGKR